MPGSALAVRFFRAEKSEHQGPFTLKRSKIQRQLRRILDAFFHTDKEGDGLFAVNGAMIVTQGKIHHRPHHDLSLEGHWPLLNRVHAEDAALRRIQNRRAEERAINAAIGNRKRAALKFLDLDLS